MSGVLSNGIATYPGTTGAMVTTGSLAVFGGGTLVLSQTPTYTGSTLVEPGGQNSSSFLYAAPGTLRLGTGVSLATNGVTAFYSGAAVAVWGGATLIVDSSNGSGSNARTTSFALENGSTLSVIGGTGSGTTTDAFGGMLLGNSSAPADGQDTITVQAGSSQTTILQFQNIVREYYAPGAYLGGATMLVTGPNLGATSGASTEILINQSAGTQVNGRAGGIVNNSGAAITFSGSNTAAATIAPFLFALPTTGTDAGITSFATYAGTTSTNTGLRALNDGSNNGGAHSEYSAANSLVATDNAMINSANFTTAGPGTNAINSLTLRSSGSTGVGFNSSGTTTVSTAGGTYGGVLSTGSVANSIGTASNASGTVLAFGTNEAIIYTATDLTVNAQITGSGGLTKGGPGDLILTNATNSLSSPAFANSGGLLIDDGTVTIDTASELGTIPTILLVGGTLRVTGTNSNVVDLSTKVVTTSPALSTGAGATLNPSQAGFNVDTGNTLKINPTTLVLDNRAGGFTKTGLGTLEFITGTSTAGYNDALVIAAGTMQMDSGAALQTQSMVIVQPGATLLFNSTNSTTTAFQHLGPVSLQAASFTVNGNTNNNTTDEVTTLGIATGESFVTVNTGGGTNIAVLTTALKGWSRSPGGTVVFRGNNLGGTTTGSAQIGDIGGQPIPSVPYVNALFPEILVDTSTNLTNVTLGYWVSSTTGFGQVPTGNITTTFNAVANNVAIASGTGTVTNAGQINSLTLGGGTNTSAVTITGTSGTSLLVASGGILNTGAGSTINVPTLLFTSGSNSTNILGGGEGIIWAIGNLTISSNIFGSSGLSVTGNGPGSGTLTLSGTNTYTGPSTWINNGTLSVSADVNLGSTNSAILGSPTNATQPVPVTLNMGGTLDVTAGFTTYRNFTVNTSGTNNSTAIQVDGGSTNFQVKGSITGPGSLSKTGTGLLTLTGNNTFTGGTFINAGTIVAASNTALAGNVTVGTSGNLQINDGIALDPIVTLTGAASQITVGSTGSVGTNGATLTGSVNGAAGATLNYNFNGTQTALLNVEQLHVSGNVTTGGTNSTWTFNFTDVNGTGISTNQAYVILDATSLGTLPQIAANITSSNYTLDTAYNNGSAIKWDSGNNTVSVEFSSVPEPSSLSLIGLGAMGLLARRRKRKHAPKMVG